MWSKKIRHRKAQASSAELLIAYFIFFIALTMAVVLWTNTTETINARERLEDFDTIAANIAEKLVRTPGAPVNWTADDVLVIGLANEPRRLSNEKVSSFIDLMNDSAYDNSCMDADISNYECNKHLLGVGKHNFYLTLEDMNATILKVGNITCAAGKYR
jgi:hypothetical protein